MAGARVITDRHLADAASGQCDFDGYLRLEAEPVRSQRDLPEDVGTKDLALYAGITIETVCSGVTRKLQQPPRALRTSNP